MFHYFTNVAVATQDHKGFIVNLHVHYTPSYGYLEVGNLQRLGAGEGESPFLDNRLLMELK
jgi:hypothetical protein